jgi:hypothetical protein
MAGIAILVDLWRKNHNSASHAFQSSSSFSASSAVAAAASFAAGTTFASRAFFGYVYISFFLFVFMSRLNFDIVFGMGFGFSLMGDVRKKIMFFWFS